MNNRLKFRAWDNHAKKMINENELIGGDDSFMPCVLFDGEFSVFELGGTCNGQDPEGIMILMQSTGIEDIKGKLIFEGDIVKEANQWISVVEWDDVDTGFCLQSKTYSYEILGNIHENKELIPND